MKLLPNNSKFQMIVNYIWLSLWHFVNSTTVRIGILEAELQRLHCVECFLFLWEGEMKYMLHLSSSLKTGWNTVEDGYHRTADRKRKLDFFESLKSAKLLKVLKGLHSSSHLST